MTYDPVPPDTPPGRPSPFGGYVLTAILIVLVIVFVIWLFGRDGDNPGTEPGQTTVPANDTTLGATTVPQSDTTLPDATTTLPDESTTSTGG